MSDDDKIAALDDGSEHRESETEEVKAATSSMLMDIFQESMRGEPWALAVLHGTALVRKGDILSESMRTAVFALLILGYVEFRPTDTHLEVHVTIEGVKRLCPSVA